MFNSSLFISVQGFDSLLSLTPPTPASSALLSLCCTTRGLPLEVLYDSWTHSRKILEDFLLFSDSYMLTVRTKNIIYNQPAKLHSQIIDVPFFFFGGWGGCVRTHRPSSKPSDSSGSIAQNRPGQTS